ncbi:uncharacterized protein PHACADRAFT_207980 [Phanerochaete carnosa HHB-10118-sp]|uniref:DUF6533 domain-containing protein n=1 Tax=Phanerochaete carnosa (strain HHB-10118-sp) TaxID=650164 RepID=K5VZ01_PHACS|nr:uncharacterized protein PHACADRAFT_207980 [Phanerochaete carnosa HHB-10118-sp]EKM56788.1 hypothetical protein PHACADRAFT_207980 [Phanerochaete carnosa HHB-10118-sp]
MATPEQIAALLQSVLSNPTYNGLTMTRYLQISSLACALYDHALTLGDEIDYIWSGRFSHIKGLYILIRYGIEGSLFYTAYMLSGFRPPLNEEVCKSFVAVLWALTMMFSISTNLYVAFHHYIVWDREKKTLYVILLCLLACYVPATIVGIKSVFDYREYVVYLAVVDQCALAHQPDIIKSFWGCLLAFDILAVAIVIANSFHRPHAHRQDILSSLRRDGAIWFTGIMILRLMNLVLSITAEPQDVFLVVFNIWSFIAITLARVILRTEGLKEHKPGTVRIWNTRSEAFELSRLASNN